jgi:hypothetical protein
MRKIALACLFFVGSLSAEPAPSADSILDSVRLRQTHQQVDLHGQLRQNSLIVPFEMVQSGPLVRYLFANPPETLQLQIGENDSRLEHVTGAGVQKVGPAQWDRKVRGTDVTYEDLALKFLYWPDGEVLGTDDIRTRNCWKLQLRAPNRQSQYARIILWVDKSGGALMRMEAFGSNNQLLKRFEVVSAQKIEDKWFLKQMRIEQFQPGTDHVLSRTYLEIKK